MLEEVWCLVQAANNTAFPFILYKSRCSNKGLKYSSPVMSLKCGRVAHRRTSIPALLP